MPLRDLTTDLAELPRADLAVVVVVNTPFLPVSVLCRAAVVVVFVVVGRRTGVAYW